MTPEELAQIKDRTAGALRARECPEQCYDIQGLIAALEASEAEVAKMTEALTTFACVSNWSASMHPADSRPWEWTFMGEECPPHIAQEALGHENGEGCGCDGCRYFGGTLPEENPAS